MYTCRTNAGNRETKTRSALYSPQIQQRAHPAAVAAMGRIPRIFAFLLLLLPVAVHAQFNYAVDDGTIRIWGYTGPGGAVTIPDTIDGLPVTIIGAAAFQGQTSLTSITIPDSVTTIGVYAFAGCTSLTSITIPTSITVIHSRAFRDCQSLTVAPIPTSITSIEAWAFAGCSSLTNLTIPDSVTNLDAFAFAACASLNTLVLGQGIKMIENNVFSTCVGLRDVEIPWGVLSIGDSAFNYCTNLDRISLPGSLTNISTSAFEDCASLINLTIPGSVVAVGANSFSRCSRLASVSCGNGIENIGGNAFAYCTNLGNVTIPDSVTNLGNGVFYGCTGLTNVTLPTTTTKIPDSLFSGCSRLSVFPVSSNVTSIGTYAFYGCTSLVNVSIPDSLNRIGYQAFVGCANLVEVVIPRSVTNIGHAAFWMCENLATITVAPLNSFYSTVDGVLFDKSQSSLVVCPEGKFGTYAIPGGTTQLQDGSFYGCYKLTSIAIPEGVTNIGASAFCYCTNLIDIFIPRSVARLGDAAFFFCSSLTEITVDASNTVYTSINGVLLDKSQTTLLKFPEARAGNFSIPNGVSGISPDAFAGTPRVNVIWIPGSITNIRSGTFMGCGSLSAIEVDANSPYFSSADGVLFNKGRTVLLQYPKAKTGNYNVPAGVATIGMSAFSRCLSLSTITIPASVTNVEAGAFYECTNLVGMYFLGDAPAIDPVAILGVSATFYYLPGTKGWDTGQDWWSKALWNPQIQTGNDDFGVRTNGFGFTITGTSNLVIVVEASTNLSSPAWSVLATNTLTDGSSYFSDPHWTNHPARFYRLRSP